MKEIKKIIEAYESLESQRKKAALATVVRVRGSAYRRPGARMLITDDGRWTGAISGGCLEGDALRKARRAILDNKPSLVTYDTMDDASATSLAVGLGCNGIIDVLIEPIHPHEKNNPIHFLKEFVEKGEIAAHATLFNYSGKNPIELGQRLQYNADQSITGNIADNTISKKIINDLKKAWIAGKPATKTYTFDHGQLEVLLEILHPGIQLVIFGGGYDAAPVVTLANQMGWEVTVTDDCIAHLGEKRFPGACQVLMAPRNSISETINFKRHSAALIMSHNYKYDLAVLKGLKDTKVQYVGIMGPKKRFDKMLDELQTENTNLPTSFLEKIHAPVGLDIGAETPDEIALSIISEIQAIFNHRKAGFLKDFKGPIHDRSAYDDEFLNDIYLNLNGVPQYKST